MADLLIEGREFGDQFLKSMEFIDLVGGEAKSRWAGKGLRDTLAVDFAQETKLRMTGIVWPSTMTGRFPAAVGKRGYGTWSEIAEGKELLQESGSSQFQIG